MKKCLSKFQWYRASVGGVWIRYYREAWQQREPEWWEQFAFAAIEDYRK